MASGPDNSLDANGRGRPRGSRVLHISAYRAAEFWFGNMQQCDRITDDTFYRSIGAI
jgi:hypothetical protein